MRNDYNSESCVDVAPIMRAPSHKYAKKCDEIAAKVVEINQIVQKSANCTIDARKDYIKDAVQGLQFSESTIDLVERGAIQLAEGDVTPLIGNYTFATLNMIVQEVGSSIENDTLLSLAFPDKLVPEYNVILDRITGVSGILPEFAGDSAPIPTARPLDTYALQYRAGLWAARTILTAKHIEFDRRRGGTGFNERGIAQLVAYNTTNLITQAITRKKYLLNQAIFFNGFSYNGADITSNIPAQNYIPMSSPLGTLNADGSVEYNNDPLYNSFIQLTNILNDTRFLKYRRYIRGILTNGADLQAIMNHPNLKAVTNLMVSNTMSLGNRKLSIQMGNLVKELTAYYAPSFEFPLLADDDVWVGQNPDGVMKTSPNDATDPNSAQNFFVPRGYMYVLLDLQAMGGQNGAFHLTLNEVDPNVQSPAMGLFTGVFSRNLNNSDTTNRLDIVASFAGAPAVYMPEAQFILTRLYQNV